ncbi:ORF6N domain-containing protein [Flagellimonas myxillae]|uniref:ORF6N domain-containing protein n=1 Tax=Flagellimonas myxillae TaxID=2942214 RepID=UPI00201E890B|nr:ORF6N domain-containing protein [Muricauda myxillae]MCL6266881.1 ORF6N domain-containing protein [Muricauda myxillae]
MEIVKGGNEIANAIIQLRGERVILDVHLSGLYEVETRILKQQVRRNLDRFPEDFMFLLNDSEIDLVISQNVIPNKKVLGGARPMAFTEQGVAMLSSVLRSKNAIQVNIAIMRTFVHVRRLLETNKELSRKINELEDKYDEQFKLVFETIKRLVNQPNEPRTQIGYKK